MTKRELIEWLEACELPDETPILGQYSDWGDSYDSANPEVIKVTPCDIDSRYSAEADSQTPAIAL